MYRFARMRRTVRSTAALVVLALASCSQDSALQANIDPPAPGRIDAGTSHPGVDAGSYLRLSTLREDFETRERIEETAGAVVDVNQGIVTLAAQSFPTVDHAGITTLSEITDYNGRVDAQSIVVLETAMLNASDSIELRARDTLRVSGRIVAGAGGVDLVAGTGLYVDGTIESEGPIRLRLSEEAGEIQIAGRIVTFDSDSKRSADVTIFARGSVTITGSVETGAANYGDTGAIVITSYQTIRVSGVSARLVTGNSQQGEAGDVELSTEGGIEVERGASIRGGASIASERSPTLEAGSVRLRAQTIGAGSDAVIGGGRSEFGFGGSLDVAVAGSLGIDSGAQLWGGSGRVGGAALVEASTATIGDGATIGGGDGREGAGRVLFGTAGRLTLRDRARVLGGAGGCAPGGDAVLLVGGRIVFEGAGTVLRGGRGGSEAGTACFGDYAGGHVQIIAQEVIGPVDPAASGGEGTPPGSTSIRLDPMFTRQAPDIQVQTSGYLVSRAIDRGADNADAVPVLLALERQTPRRTFAIIELAGGDDPSFEPQRWHLLDRDAPQLLEPLRGHRWLRYRVTLKGRALDAPVLDYFEVGLSGP